MNPPDYNWACFIGRVLGLILQTSGAKLNRATRTAVATSLDRACLCIERRQVGIGYTNIAIREGMTCNLAALSLGKPHWKQFAEKRLSAVLERLGKLGNREYNSPIYTFVAVGDIDILQHLPASRRITSTAKRLHAWFWDHLTRFYHPGSGQFIGPMSRVYHYPMPPSKRNHLEEYSTHFFLDEQSSRVIPKVADLTTIPTDLVPAIPPPHSAQARLAKRMTRGTCFHLPLARLKTQPASLQARVWMNQDAALGSVNAECLWDQRVPLSGVWRDQGDLYVLSVAMLLDGHPWASALLYTQQEKHRVLCQVRFTSNLGRKHCLLYTSPSPRD